MVQNDYSFLLPNLPIRSFCLASLTFCLWSWTAGWTFVRSQRYLLVIFKVSFVLARREGGALSQVSTGLAYRPVFHNGGLTTH